MTTGRSAAEQEATTGRLRNCVLGKLQKELKPPDWRRQTEAELQGKGGFPGWGEKM